MGTPASFSSQIRFRINNPSFGSYSVSEAVCSTGYRAVVNKAVRFPVWLISRLTQWLRVPCSPLTLVVSGCLIRCGSSGQLSRTQTGPGWQWRVHTLLGSCYDSIY